MPFRGCRDFIYASIPNLLFLFHIFKKIFLIFHVLKKIFSPFLLGLFRLFPLGFQHLLDSLFDEKVYYKVRLKAAELIGELGSVEAIEPLRNSECKNQLIVTKVCDAIKRIHEISETRECPYCTEIIEAKATTCSQCGKDLS